MTRLLAYLLLLPALVCQSAVAGQPPWQAASAWPDRIIVTLGDNPDQGFNVSWRTDDSVTATVAEIAPAGAAARFDVHSMPYPAQSERFEFDPEWAKGKPNTDPDSLRLDPVRYHSVAFDGLEPDTLYAYRVRGSEDNWSPWRQVRTAPAGGAFEFVFFGDAQNGIRSHVSRVIDAAAEEAPEARFLLHAGDLINSGLDDLGWAEWFQAGGSLFQRVPSIPTPGNHDYYWAQPEDSDGPAQRRVTPLWRPQFRLPVVESLPAALAETVYDVRYTPDLHLFAIDSTGPAFDRQLEWLGAQLDASDARWRVVFMHHPFFSWVGDGEEKEDQTVRREQFDTFLEQYDVDLVLTGHRHSYQRAESGAGVHGRDKRQAYAVDTVFVVTAMTIKRGETKTEGWEKFSQEREGNITLTRWGDYVPLFGIFDVDGDTIRYRAVDALGDTYDAFTLQKEAQGRKLLSNGEAAFGATWTLESAGPYRDWRE